MKDTPRVADLERRRTLAAMRPPRTRTAPEHRAPIPPAAVRAAYRAHRDLEHDPDASHCATCRRYLAGIARAAELTAQTPAPPPRATT